MAPLLTSPKSRAQIKREIDEVLARKPGGAASYQGRWQHSSIEREIESAIERDPIGSSSLGPTNEDAKAQRVLLEKELDAANEVLKVFPRGAMGLVPDAVAQTQEYRSANARFQKAFARLLKFKQAPLKPHWTTLETDRDGKPTIRVWRLPRMSHPGMAVWDTLRNASRGRYEVMTEVRTGELGQRSGRETYETTGLRFRNLDELSQYIRETSQL